MGRQKTLWIDEACWEKLEEMGDDPVSAKIRRAIMQHDVNLEDMVQRGLDHILALRKQRDSLKKALKETVVELAKANLAIKDDWMRWVE